MAGAGPVTEKLPSIYVPEKLVNGGTFLKWDDLDANCNVYILKVDLKGYVLSWRPEDFSKDTEVLEIVHIRDVRTGQYARSPKTQDIRAREAIKAFCVNDQEASFIAERTVTVVYGPNMVELTFVNFVATSISEAEEWTEHLFKCTNNLLESNASPLQCLERFFTKIAVQSNQDGEIPAKLLVKHLVTGKDDKKRAYDTLQNTGLAAGKKDTIKLSDFTFENFLSFYNRIVTRKDLDTVFAELGAKKKPYLTTEQLVYFLNNRQRDPRLNEILFPYYNTTRAQNIITCYERNKDFATKGYFSIEGLTSFLMSEDNPVLLPQKLQLHQDMSFPLAHYFINSSHNTYLTGHQLTGKSSVEIYRQVLLAGCRCIELDCWDGKTDDMEPVITHGLTLCTEVPFKEVIEAIAESAFKTSDYPVILSFENHCSAKQQEKMANYCVQIFGDMLLSKTLEDFPLDPGIQLPSPNRLKRKILIKNKKRVMKETKVATEAPSEQSEAPSEAVEVDGSIASESTLEEMPEEVEIEVVPKCEEEEQPEVEAQQELSELVNYFQPVHFRGFDRAEKAMKYYEMSSFSENAAMNLLKDSPVEFVNYNKFQQSRIYPKGKRVSSDNYNPQMFWNAGCQLVALNFQTLDVPMMLNLGKFETNGRSGYLLKPEHMRRKDRTFDPFVDSIVDGVIAGTVHVRIISGQCLSERRCGTYVDVEMFGLPADMVRKQHRTKVVPNNGLNPVYEEEPFKFKVILPQLAVLRFCVYEDNGKFIGHRILPVDGLSPGFRHIKLRNESYQPLCLPTLFVEILTKDYVPESLTDFANALTNPMKYLSEKEKRAKQLEVLMIDDQDKDDISGSGAGNIEKPPASPDSNGSNLNTVSLPSCPTNKGDKDVQFGCDVVSGRTSSVPSRSPDENKNNATHSEGIEHTDFNMQTPDLDALEKHKLYLKIKAKHDNEMQSLVQKHAKERSRINKELEINCKKIRTIYEKQKSVIQKKQSKTLKKAEREGTHTEQYTSCVEEINKVNENLEKELKDKIDGHGKRLVELYKKCYEEQFDLAKSHTELKLSEQNRILKLIESSYSKKMTSHHERKFELLKNAQDSDRTYRMKYLAKEVKDQSKLFEQRKMENKKHVEQSVKQRLKLKEFQDKEVEKLSNEFTELESTLEENYKKKKNDLEKLYEEKVSLLETQDLGELRPVLLDEN